MHATKKAAGQRDGAGFSRAAPLPPDRYELWDPSRRMQMNLKRVSPQEAKELSDRTKAVEATGAHEPEKVLSLVAVEPVPSEILMRKGPVKVPVFGYREGALAYFVEAG